MKEVDMSNMQFDAKQKKEAFKEVLVLKSLTHPGIVRLHDAFLSEDRKLCIVMELATGDLATHLQKTAPRMPGEEIVLPWMLQLVQALSYLHQHKVLHRDLKPANILLTAEGRLKIADFGISKPLDSTAGMAFTRIGTLLYMAPEMVSNSFSGYTGTVDIWALGCIFFEMLTGCAPFHAQSMHQLVQKIQHDATPSLPKTVRADLHELVMAMLSKRPEKRPTPDQILSLPLMQCVAASEKEVWHKVAIPKVPSQATTPAHQVRPPAPPKHRAPNPQVLQKKSPQRPVLPRDGAQKAAPRAQPLFCQESPSPARQQHNREHRVTPAAALLGKANANEAAPRRHQQHRQGPFLRQGVAVPASKCSPHDAACHDLAFRARIAQMHIGIKAL